MTADGLVSTPSEVNGITDDGDRTPTKAMNRLVHYDVLEESECSEHYSHVASWYTKYTILVLAFQNLSEVFRPMLTIYSANAHPRIFIGLRVRSYTR